MSILSVMITCRALSLRSLALCAYIKKKLLFLAMHPLDFLFKMIYSIFHYGGVAKLVYRAGLSRRRSRVRAPSLPKKLTALVVSFFYFISAFLFTGSSAGVARLVRDQEVGGSNPPCPIAYSLLYIGLSNY